MRLARAFGVDGNPLRRASDRAEAWLRAGLLVVFLTVGPIAALTAVQWITHATGTATSATRAQPHAVQAAPPQTATTPAGRAVAVWGARWESGSGSGQVTGTPQRGSAFTGVLAAVLALTVTAFALLIALRLTQWFLDWRRLAGWEAAWRATGPRWTGRRSSGEHDDC